MDSIGETRFEEAVRRTREQYQDAQPIGELIEEVLDKGEREKEGEKGKYRVRTPTNSERMNRALAELRPAAFKIHALLWKWRGAPARGTLPFFTFHSLSKFCGLTRPTVRTAMRELVVKGWISRKKYSKHHKNALYSLVAIREIQRPRKGDIKNIQRT